jgi:hypothetical protein
VWCPLNLRLSISQSSADHTLNIALWEMLTKSHDSALHSHASIKFDNEIGVFPCLQGSEKTFTHHQTLSEMSDSGIRGW